MKMMSKTNSVYCDYYLRGAATQLERCLKIMQGKYGTHEAVSAIKAALIEIKDCVNTENYYVRVYQKFRNPPNTPKSRRLGWNKKGEIK